MENEQKQQPGEPYAIDQDKCVKCGICQSKCPFKSILKNA